MDMVMDDPFDKLFSHVAQMAQRQPQQAFEQLEQLYNKSISADQVLQICALASNLGGAALGHMDATIAFLKQLLEHPALVHDAEEVKRSIWRALTVMHICCDDTQEAEAARVIGVTNASENCRLSTMAANTLIARQRFAQAIPHLKLSAALCQEIASDDDVIKQVALVSSNISRMAEGQLLLAKELLTHATYACKQAWLTSDDWRIHHKAHYNSAKAFLQTGQVTQALTEVGLMMRLEGKHQGTPVEQFFSAAIACRGQCMRGQINIARQAMDACTAFVQHIASDNPSRAVVDTILAEVTAVFTEASTRAARA